ncbi:hypothetical protein C9374_013388 [Naegleria lovaniensis]|uniref:Importin subunit alpha n=1 Tax=Naegleria lovaniensis TaxID=51637 RepID=A0AA88GZ86_NAELO|nr:uncharacterized protein C9374_013388 [Naegleria lovaniensis]KAG2391903.1 hypothetical protein C9374_013388 [Naegleria lovaniensis]
MNKEDYEFRKKGSIKTLSEVSYTNRKQHRIDIQRQSYKNKKSELLNQLKRKKQSENCSGTSEDHAVDNIGIYIEQLESLSNNLPQKLIAIKQCRIILSKCSLETLNDILSAYPQFVHIFHQHLTSKYSELQLESAWCITNIAAVRDDCVAFCIPTLVHIISNSFIDIVLQEQCIWALGNIALGLMNEGNIPLSTVIVQNGAVPYLANIIRACRINEVVKTTLWCVSNIIKNELLHYHTGSESQQLIWNSLGNLYEPVIYLLLKRQLTDVESIRELLFVLTYLTAIPVQFDDESQSKNLLSQIAQICVKYLKLQNCALNVPIVRLLGNLFSSINLFSLLDQPVAFELMNLLISLDDKNKEWCYMLSNISSFEEINEILVQNYSLIEVMNQIISQGCLSNDKELLREATITLINLVTANQNRHLTLPIAQLITKQVTPNVIFDDSELNQQFKTILEQFCGYASTIFPYL